MENGLLAITAAGVDKMLEQNNIVLRRDRLIAENAMGGAPDPVMELRELNGLLR